MRGDGELERKIAKSLAIKNNNANVLNTTKATTKIALYNKRTTIVYLQHFYQRPFEHPSHVGMT